MQRKKTPESSKNISNTIGITNYSKCTYLEGTFKIDKTIWPLICQNNKLHPNRYPFYLRNRMARYVNNVCQIKIKYKYFSKRKQIHQVFAKCIHKCKLFKIILDVRSLIAKVYSSSKDYCHGTAKHTTYVTGIERDILKNKLRKEEPFEFKKVHFQFKYVLSRKRKPAVDKI